MNFGGPIVYISIAGAIFLLAGLSSFVWKPGVRFSSAAKHFAAGMVFAAVGVDLIPQVEEGAPLWAVLVGFAIGAGYMLLIRWWTHKQEQKEAGGSAKERSGKSSAMKGQKKKQAGEKSQAPSPSEEHKAGSFSLVVTIAQDIFLDGILLGVISNLGQRQGLILAVALASEFFSLSISSVANYSRRIGGTWKRIGLIFGLSVAPVLGALLGLYLLNGLSEIWLRGIIAFGMAAFIYLVVEELIAEAHDQAITMWNVAMFFVGFIFLIGFEIWQKGSGSGSEGSAFLTELLKF